MPNQSQLSGQLLLEKALPMTSMTWSQTQSSKQKGLCKVSKEKSAQPPVAAQ